MAVVVLSMIVCYTCVAVGLDTWHWRHPSPQGNSITAITYGNSLFVATAGRSILTSQDATSWDTHPIAVPANLNSVAFGNDTFVAVALATVATSTDGTNWAVRPTGRTNLLTGVAFGNGRFVAVGNGGQILVSIDGRLWSRVSSAVPSSYYFVGIGFGNGLFVAVANTSDMATSPDGFSWTTSSGAGVYPKRVAYGNDTFFVAGSISQYSNNGVDWTSNNADFDAVGFGDGVFVAVRTGGGISTSTNGVQWTVVQPSGSSDDLSALGFGNGTYVVGGRNGLLRTSSNATNWVTRSSALTYQGELYGATHANGQFVVVGDAGAGEQSPILTSPDGRTWTRQVSGSYSTFWGVASGNGIYSAIWSFGATTSLNGIDWTNQNVGLSGQLRGITYGNGTFVIVGSGGQIATSPDGITWTPRTSPTTRNLRDVTYGGGLFVAVGLTFGASAGAILTSNDGVTWTNRNTVNLRSVAWRDGMYVVVGDGGVIRTSTNAVNWITQSSGTTNILFGVAGGHGVFLAVGENGTILSSADGVAWMAHPTGTSQTLYDLAAGPDSFIVTGAGGSILQSDNLGLPRPGLMPAAYSSSLGFDLQLIGTLGFTYVIQYSSDLRAWSDLKTITPTDPSTWVQDPTATNAAHRFYRAVVR